MIKEEDDGENVNTDNYVTTTYSRSIGHMIMGLVLILSGILIFVVFTISIIITKTEYFQTNYLAKQVEYEYNSEFSKNLITFLITDKHCCLALPIFIPVAFIILYFRWTAFAYFKHS